MAQIFNTDLITTEFGLNLTELLKTGLQLRRTDNLQPFWEDVDGLQFTESSIKRKPGRLEITGSPASSPIRGMITNIEGGNKVVYYGDLTDLYRYTLETDVFENVGSGYSLIENAGDTEWDSGSTTWDSGTTVWDEGATQASRWSFTKFGTWIFAANNIGPIQVKKNSVTFNDLFNNEISGISINNGGTGYNVGDTITFTGGTGTGFTATVEKVSGTTITQLKVTNWGDNYTNGNTLTQNTTSGGGTGINISVVIPNCPFTRVRAVSRLGPHILAINYDKGGETLPFDFAWCSADNPDDWIASATNSAGSLTIREANTELKCIVPLSDGLAIYTEDQLFLVNYIKAPFYFGYRTVMSSGVGAVSGNSVVSVDRINYGLSRRGFFMTDGSQTELIGVEEGINDFVNQNIATTEYPQVSAWHNTRDNEVVWSIPILSNVPNYEFYYNYKNNIWGKRITQSSAYQAAGVFDEGLSGDVNGLLYYEGDGPTLNAGSVTAIAIDFENEQAIKELTSIRIRKTGVGTPKVELGWSDNKNGDPNYVYSINVDKEDKLVHLRTAGRFLTVKVSSQNTTDDWDINHLEVRGRVRGAR